MRVVFFGTPEFAIPSLKKLTEFGHDILAAFSQPDRPSGRGLKIQPTPVKQVAAALGIPVHQPAKLNTEEVKNRLVGLNPEIIVVAAYGKIIPKWMLELPHYGVINVHASLLPKYRGAAPINWAIINGEKISGVTIMQMDETLDTGDILMQEPVAIGPEETAGELHDRLALLGADLLCQTLAGLAAGAVRAIKQDSAQATMAPKIDRELGKIDWSRSAPAIHNLIRGLNPWPGAYAYLRGQMLHIWRSRVAPPPGGALAGNASAPCGQVAAVSSEEIVVRCGNADYLGLMELQRPGRKKLPAREFIHGVNIAVGELLSSG
jgi:methionyl-tRNA formyltransferase